MGGRRAGCAAGTVTFLLPSLSHSDRAQSPSSNAKSAPQYYCTIETEVNAIPLWPSIHRYQRKSGPYVSGMVLGRPPTAASTAVQNVQLTRLEFMRFVYTRYTRVVFVLLCVLLCIQRLLYFYLRSTDTKSATLTRARGDISSSSSSSSSSRCRNRTHPKFVESGSSSPLIYWGAPPRRCNSPAN